MASEPPASAPPGALEGAAESTPPGAPAPAELGVRSSGAEARVPPFAPPPVDSSDIGYELTIAPPPSVSRPSQHQTLKFGPPSTTPPSAAAPHAAPLNTAPLTDEASQARRIDAPEQASLGGDSSVPPPPAAGSFDGFSSAPPEALRPRVSRVPTQRSPRVGPMSVRGVDRSDPLLGRSLAGKYTLTGLLGEGAMGQVYRGVHETLGTPIAVKVMRRNVAGDEVYRRRFAREARAASLLAHPCAVRVLDYGDDDGLPYIVMEFVEGQDLDAWLHEQPALPPIALVGELGDQILGALSAAHGLGIVHRDLKPENVMLTWLSDGQLLAKVSDFGLAHVEDPRDSQPTLTQRDAVAGTPAYMSPEQCRSLAVGPSTDLYAFGCLLTALLQGRPPFDGTSPIDVISKQMFAEPPALSRPSGAEPVPPLLERLRLDLLAKKAHKRPLSAEDTRARLAEAVSREANRRIVPDRKGDVPLGARGERVLEQTLAIKDEQSAPEAPELRAMQLTLAGGAEVDATLRMGLASLRVQLHAFEAAGEGVVLLLAPDAASAAAWLAGHAGRAALVHLPQVDTAGINTLIAAGAREVMAGPLESGGLARRLARAARRSRG